jgi:hypothetical protein
MSPRFAQMQPLEEMVHVVAPSVAAADGHGRSAARNLLLQETVPMTVLAQDPSVGSRPVVTTIPVPAERLEPGPQGHRFAVVDADPDDPVVLHGRDSWTYRDRWARKAPEVLAASREFRAQNVFAVAAHTLALVERYLGRPIPWYGGDLQLVLRPQWKAGRAVAFYSRAERAVQFGWVTPLGDRRAVFTALSYDVIAHEVTHAVLDGLRPRFAEPGLPDQLAFHEALADLVALLSVFTLDGVAERLLEPVQGRVVLGADTAARAAALMKRPLTRLAEQVCSQLRLPGGLRQSGVIAPSTAWKRDPAYTEPHRRSEILVSAFLHTLVGMWAGRLEPLGVDAQGGLDSARVAEEGVKSAEHLLGMLLRSLDYLPPVDLEFPDVIDSVLTADARLAPDDAHHYRDALEAAFGGFGIVPPEHRILDEDGVAAPARKHERHGLGIRYEHLNLAALRSSPEEVFSFLWNNARVLGVDVGFPTRVERVLSSTRVGPDGLVVTEILADYTQNLRTTVAHLPRGVHPPEGAAADAPVELWGGGVLVFDQFGRFRLHQRQPLLDGRRQTRRLAHLSATGAGDPTRAAEPFALLHGAEPA